MEPYVHEKDEWLQMQRGRELYDSGDGEGCLFILKRLSADGYYSPLLLMGLVYETGCGTVRKDLDRAIKYYRESVESIDDVYSHRSLARIYMQNFKHDPDHSLLVYHLNVLEDSEEIGGYYGHGLVHQYGLGVPIDHRKAAERFRKAIEGGHIIARVNLAQVAKPPSIRLTLAAIWASLKAKVLLLRDRDHPELGI